MVNRKRCLYCAEHSAFAECKRWRVAQNGVLWSSDVHKTRPYFRPHADFCCNEFQDIINAKGSGELLEALPGVLEWRYSIVQIPAGMIDEDGGRLENYLCGEGSTGLELTCIIPSPAGFLAIFKRRRRTESDQGKCCECGGQESEGVLCVHIQKP